MDKWMDNSAPCSRAEQVTPSPELDRAMHRFDFARHHAANALPSLAAIEPVPHGRHVPGVIRVIAVKSMFRLVR
jgi:hypothetical protein